MTPRAREGARPVAVEHAQHGPRAEASTPRACALDVQRVPTEAPLVDLLAGDSRREVRIGEHGFVALIDVMPRLVQPNAEGLATADAAIVQAARVSYGAGTKRVSEDRGLIRYLMRHRHTTPFEMVELKFHVSMPIFVARQWIRHRTASVNEYSGRYSEMPDHFFSPDAARAQSASNRQGGDETLARSSPQSRDFYEYLQRSEDLYEEYKRQIDAGISRELARIALPQSIFTQWYWKCDLHNTLRFLSLRMDSHAQAEIRIYAQAMHDLIAPLCPHTIEAWHDYEFAAVRLTRLESNALAQAIAAAKATAAPHVDSENKRERAEWSAKAAELGLSVPPDGSTPQP